MKNFIFNFFLGTVIIFIIFGCKKNVKISKNDCVFIDTPYWIFYDQDYELALKKMDLIKSLKSAINKKIVIVGCADLVNNEPTLNILFNSQMILIKIKNLQNWDFENKQSHRSLIFIEGKLNYSQEEGFFLELIKYNWVDS